MSENKTLPLYTIDAFTSKPFSGNPAAVCLDDVRWYSLLEHLYVLKMGDNRR